MKIHTAGLSALMLSAVAFQANAQQTSFGHVDAFYIPSANLELTVTGLGSADDDGDGFGAKGRFHVAEQIFIAAEYQAVEYDDSNIELDQIRAGVGAILPISTSVSFLGLVEFIDADIDDPNLLLEGDDGFGVHGKLEASLTGQFTIHGGVGFLKFGDSDGPEFHIGARFQVTPNASIFVDYRTTRLSEDGNDLDFDDLRLGAGFHF